MRIDRTQTGFPVLFGLRSGLERAELPSVVVDLSADSDLIAGIELIGILYCVTKAVGCAYLPEELPQGVESAAREDILYIALNRDQTRTPYRCSYPSRVRCEALLASPGEIVGVLLYCPPDWICEESDHRH